MVGKVGGGGREVEGGRKRARAHVRGGGQAALRGPTCIATISSVVPACSTCGGVRARVGRGFYRSMGDPSMGGSIYGGSLHGGSNYLWEGVGWGAGEGRPQRRWLACARAREDWGVCVRACVRTSVSTSVDLNKFAGETEDWGVCVRACVRARALACVLTL